MNYTPLGLSKTHVEDKQVKLPKCVNLFFHFYSWNSPLTAENQRYIQGIFLLYCLCPQEYNKQQFGSNLTWCGVFKTSLILLHFSKSFVLHCTFLRSDDALQTAVKTSSVAQCVALLPHSKKVVGSSPASCNMSGLVPGPFCVEFACSPRVTRVPPVEPQQ